MNVKAACKVCGCESPADQFKLHIELKQMVCPSCFRGKPKKEEPVKNEPKKPAGWDSEDEYLELASLQKRQTQQAAFRKIPGSSHVECTCQKCRYVFKYDYFRKHPKSCPYCNAQVPRFKHVHVL